MRNTLLFTGLLALLAGCNGKDNENKASAAPANANCRREKPAADDGTTGGCRIRLVTPAPNEEIDLTDGKTYEFAWTNDGTTCELPYHAYIAGNPIQRNEDGSLGNVGKWDLNANEGQIGSHGGFVRLRAEDLEGLTSCDGTYEWVIESFHGSHPASQVFKVRK